MSHFPKRNEWMHRPDGQQPLWTPIELFVVDGRLTMPKLGDIIDLQSPWLWVCVASILFNPLFWNTVARNEYRNKTMTKMFGGPYRGTYVLAVTIFSLGILRDWIFKRAMATQPSAEILGAPLARLFAIGCFAWGQVLVLTSIYALGITGTYLGDYFGILMKERVTGFPFNIMENPMYNGSTLAFIGTAVWYQKPAGLIISGLVWVVYQIALAYEGPFTNKIYSGASKKDDSRRSARSVRDATPPPGVSYGPTVTGSSSAPAPAPATPAKSSKSASSAPARGHATSYASAVAEPPAPAGLPSKDPQPVKGVVPVLAAEESAGAGGSPMRVTRSRSRARLVDDDN